MSRQIPWAYFFRNHSEIRHISLQASLFTPLSPAAAIITHELERLVRDVLGDCSNERNGLKSFEAGLVNLDD